MAEKQEKKSEEKASAPPPPSAAPQQEKKASGGLMKSTPVLLGVVMIIEAAVLFAGFKMLGGSPKSAHGADTAQTEGGEGKEGEGGEGGTAPKTKKKELVELPVLELKAPNKLTGRTFLYDVSIYVLTKGADQKTLEDAIADRKKTIEDRVRTIIAQTDPEKLGGGSEPGLETLRRQVKYQLDELIGKDKGIEEVLIPRCTPYRSEF